MEWCDVVCGYDWVVCFGCCGDVVIGDCDCVVCGMCLCVKVCVCFVCCVVEW